MTSSTQWCHTHWCAANPRFFRGFLTAPVAAAAALLAVADVAAEGAR
jgi:hypothetical protein